MSKLVGVMEKSFGNGQRGQGKTKELRADPGGDRRATCDHAQHLHVGGTVHGWTPYSADLYVSDDDEDRGGFVLELDFSRCEGIAPLIMVNDGKIEIHACGDEEAAALALFLREAADTYRQHANYNFELVTATSHNVKLSRSLRQVRQGINDLADDVSAATAQATNTTENKNTVTTEKER
jgi:hypothetical protein